ncbi:hypothetical protein M409DRAFT_61896 [Zasmidium cellare ATCC 36951]|uniref:Uncharacterized protein n=1 Tax=Zasmidium cellare ATCC 36951 TaxID=1080233 RepID=A0A6A6D4Y5_ZASCE|nr:uncharacterized protein M409DRAFT_61896 [Zasmidium cellare ATCC 36951]KAF2173478.1 hypothetical protein M409DRAFT_61896 [Zasmidium cellare ATCC 36951]
MIFLSMNLVDGDFCVRSHSGPLWGRHNPNTLNTTHPVTTLVLATLAADNNEWISDELSDLLGSSTNLHTAIYVVDNPLAPLHTPTNKGHESLAYLSYIIDFYSTLPEISIFLHGHPSAWHNNHLLNMSTSEMIRHLNREKVLREGYVNLRCHWSPGCPDHLHPQATAFDSTKTEELHIAATWTDLFPEEPLPPVLSQPCCSQFAVSATAIRRHPVEKYILFRDWILQTPLSDYITGRIFEYFWQYIFLSEAVYCPDPRICYCDGYGVCFEDPEGYAGYFELVMEVDQLKKELEAWARFREGKLGGRAVRDGDEGPDPVVEGGDAREGWLEGEIRGIEEELERRRGEAFEVGRDPLRRARAIEMARDLTMVDPKDGPPFWTAR